MGFVCFFAAVHSTRHGICSIQFLRTPRHTVCPVVRRQWLVHGSVVRIPAGRSTWKLCRKPEPLSFERNVAESWKNFETEFDIFVQAAYGDEDEHIQAYILLNLAGREAIEKEKIIERHRFNTRVRQPSEPTCNILSHRSRFCPTVANMDL